MLSTFPKYPFDYVTKEIVWGIKRHSPFLRYLFGLFSLGQMRKLRRLNEGGDVFNYADEVCMGLGIDRDKGCTVLKAKSVSTFIL